MYMCMYIRVCTYIHTYIHTMCMHIHTYISKGKIGTLLLASEMPVPISRLRTVGCRM